MSKSWDKKSKDLLAANICICDLNEEIANSD